MTKYFLQRAECNTRHAFTYLFVVEETSSEFCNLPVWDKTKHHHRILAVFVVVVVVVGIFVVVTSIINKAHSHNTLFGAFIFDKRIGVKKLSLSIRRFSLNLKFLMGLAF